MASTAPDPGGLAKIASELNIVHAATQLRELKGGANPVDLVEFTAGSSSHRVVLKRFPAHVSPHHEWDALRFVHASDVTTPEPLLYNDDGTWFGQPAMVMSMLPGQLQPEPDQLERWCHSLATTLAEIHATDMTKLTPGLRGEGIWQTWKPNHKRLGSRSGQVNRVLTRLRSTMWEKHFCH